MTHTPGTWSRGRMYGAVVSDQTDGKLYGGADDPGGIEAYGGHLIAESIAGQNIPIIAAAPKMLETLKTIENDDNKVPQWLWDRIKAVIAEAEGTTP